MKNKVINNQRMVMILIAILLLAACFPVTASAAGGAGTAGSPSLGPNGTAAKTLFGIRDDSILTAGSMEELTQALESAGEQAEGSRRFMVYMRPGDYTVSGEPVIVPSHVVLTGETGTRYTYTGTKRTYFVKVQGSVFGGTFIGNRKLKNCRCLIYEDQSFSELNGIIRNINVSKARTSAIEARGPHIKGCQVLFNTISDCGTNGVRAIGGATIDLIEGNTMTGLGQSGIDLTSGNAGTIRGNTITGVRGHGISTDTEQEFDNCKSACYIKEVVDNQITGAGVNGIYLEERCHITGSVRDNRINGCKGWGIGVQPSGSIKGISCNRIYDSGKSNLGVYGKVYMGSNNIIEHGKGSGIAVDKGGKLYIKGCNNKIRNNRKNGIFVSKKSYLSMQGRWNYLYHNTLGIAVEGQGRAVIKSAKIFRNRDRAIYLMQRSALTRKGCRILGSVYRDVF